ncbi:imidazole glycerol phosphate synthase subunit HisH [Treponema sp. OMZ 840]|uniref:imidazole glycerol phosphate synthase subunit HisH n=1 Tax=Treponema sp. OMZ 840 TaxID=244313 RepID=UPI003D903356
MIGVIDYKAGNIQSVKHALDFLHIDYIIADKPQDLAHADRIIFPGVGNAAYAMKQLKKTGFDSFLKDKTAEGIPLLGICLGSQIIFEYSQEDDVFCLALLKGTIKHFTNIAAFNTDLKIPHMGWNDIRYADKECRLFKNIPEYSDMYFVHSYVIQPADDTVVCAYTDYGIKVPAAIHAQNIYACQFHPEKSGKIGLTVLRNFAELTL